MHCNQHQSERDFLRSKTNQSACSLVLFDFTSARGLESKAGLISITSLNYIERYAGGLLSSVLVNQNSFQTV